MEGRTTRTRPTQRSSSWIGIVLVVAVALGIWLLNGRDPGTGTSPGPEMGEAVSGAPADGETSYQGSYDPMPTDGSGPTGPTASAGGDGEAGDVDPDSGLPFVSTVELPAEALDTLDLIDAGGPFPYDKDGSTFGNFEGILPDRQRGYYAEYTVPTPGSRDRGARRIVAGDEDELYWTEDHYASFERIQR